MKMIEDDTENNFDDAPAPTSENPYLPLFIDFSNKIVMIFGGGAVGERKALRFMNRAQTVVVSKQFTPRLEEEAKAGNIRLIHMNIFNASDLDLGQLVKGVFLVIPAMNNAEQNKRIVHYAHIYGSLINETGGSGEVIIPSLIERNGLQIAISSGGESPAVTKYARLQIEKAIGADFEKMIEIQNEIREYLKSVVSEQKERQEILWTIMDSNEIWDLLKSDDETDFEKAKEKAFLMAGK
ncbi:Siroheme synthase [Methanosarcinaceae archaeon Ag5]|uniref:precorrin-2 dehydrogenase n=1 Tax=Methanolapillus africanus TaxID=3028297 RepID=A0AAE4SD82_9EURY|nr:Siroheme synthase [Methanosarcinaceae archaeon Ag5]